MDNKLLLFLGSGSSGAIGLPTMKNLVKLFKESIKKSNNDVAFTILNDIISFSEKIYGYIDLEFLFTVLKDISENKEISDLNITSAFLFHQMKRKNTKLYTDRKDEFLYLLKELKTFIRTRLELSDDNLELIDNIYGDFFKRIGQRLNWQSSNDILIGDCAIYTTNYDNVMEEFWRGKADLEEFWEKVNGVEYLRIDITDTNRTAMRLIKLHGSLDWYKTKDGKIVKLDRFRNRYGGKEMVDEMIIYPFQPKDLYLDPWYDLFTAFKHSLSQSKNWIVIGYGFNDIYIREIFIDELTKHTNPNMIIVSPEAKDIIKNKFSSILNVNEKIKPINEKFDKKIIEDIVSKLN